MLYLNHPFTVDFEKFEKYIGVNGRQVYVDLDLFQDILGHLDAQCDASNVNVTDLVMALSNGHVDAPTPQKVVKALTQFGDVNPDEILKYSSTYRKSVPSADKKVLGELCRVYEEKQEQGKLPYLKEKSLRIMKSYIDYRELVSAAGGARKILRRILSEPGRVAEGTGWSKTCLGSIPYQYVQHTTARYYTFDHNVQGLNGALLPSLTVPDGYYLWWGDLEQIDLRVFMNSLLMQGDEELRNIMRRYDDKYESFIRYMFQCLGKTFDYDEFKKNRDKYKTGVLACLYGVSAQSLTQELHGDSKMARMFIDFFNNNQAYAEFKNNVIDAINFGAGVTIEDYFGVRRTVDLKSDAADQHSINQCINMPNQCGSNSVIVMWVNAVMDRFRALGYDEDSIYVYLIRHDEVLIAFKKEVFKDLWILDDYSKIQIDDWDLIEMKSGIGIYYTEELSELTGIYNTVCEEHKNEYFVGSAGVGRYYKPLKPIVRAVVYSGYKPIAFCQKILKLDEVPESEDMALEIIKGRSRGSETLIQQVCENYIRFYGKVCYRDPVSGEWISNADIDDVFDLDNGGLVLYNMTNSCYDFDGKNVIKYYIYDSKSLLDVLINGNPLPDLQIKSVKHKSGYSKHSSGVNIDCKADDYDG